MTGEDERRRKSERECEGQRLLAHGDLLLTARITQFVSARMPQFTKKLHAGMV